MKKVSVLIALALLLILATSCLPGPNSFARSPREGRRVVGFWHGLWHGFIAPFTFIASLFTKGVSIYEVHNNGTWYNLGYLLGMAVILGGSGGGAVSRRSHH